MTIPSITINHHHHSLPIIVSIHFVSVQIPSIIGGVLSFSRIIPMAFGSAMICTIRRSQRLTRCGVIASDNHTVHLLLLSIHFVRFMHKSAIKKQIHFIHSISFNPFHFKQKSTVHLLFHQWSQSLNCLLTPLN